MNHNTPNEYWFPLKLTYTLPDWPLYPKFVRIPLPKEKCYKYFLSSIELNRSPCIYTNCFLDLKLNFVVPYDSSSSPPNISKEDEFLLEPAEPKSKSSSLPRTSHRM